MFPGVGAFPRAMRTCCARARRARARAGGGGHARARDVLGMQLAFDPSSELGGAAGLGSSPDRSSRSKPGALKLPHIGWTEVSSVRRGVGLTATCPAAAPSTTCTPTRRCPPLRGTSSATPSTALRSSRRRARVVLRRPVPPREVSAAGLRLLVELLPDLRAGPIWRPRHDPLPGDRHPRRQRRAPRKGDFEAKKVYDQDPLSAARGWAEAGAASARRGPRRR